jgi:hypothetical protein
MIGKLEKMDRPLNIALPGIASLSLHNPDPRSVFQELGEKWQVPGRRMETDPLRSVAPKLALPATYVICQDLTP